MERERPLGGSPALVETYERQVARPRAPRKGHRPSAARRRRWLGDELGVPSGPLLDRILALGVTAETAAAFEALPLVEVSWADGSVGPEERWRILHIATGLGLELGGPAHAQLELWLSRPPGGELYAAWNWFAERILTKDPDRARRVVEGVDEVAAADGGLFGLRSISARERTVIERVQWILAPALHPDAGTATTGT